METTFNGFTPKTIQFLKDLSENNYKEWFEENRSVYENELLNPFKQLVITLSPTMHNIDEGFELRPHRVLSRIYRDVRFSKNKEPYKTHLWMSFQQPNKDWANFPGYFMELDANQCYYGMGLYACKRKVMDGLRERLELESTDFQENTQKNVLDRGFKIEGEEYKRTVTNNLGEYFQPWVQRKSVYVSKVIPISDYLFSAKFADQLRDDYLALEWLYKFFKEEY